MRVDLGVLVITAQWSGASGTADPVPRGQIVRLVPADSGSSSLNLQVVYGIIDLSRLVPGNLLHDALFGLTGDVAMLSTVLLMHH
jgi:hypothetical protein